MNQDFSSTETGLKNQKYIADQISEMMDSFQQRLTLDNPRFIERYIESKLHLLVHFRVGSINEEFVACLQGKQVVGGLDKRGWQVFQEGMVFGIAEHLSDEIFDVWSNGGYKINTTKSGTDSYQQSMLISDVEAMEHPQLVSLPSLIWLDTAEHIYSIWPKVLYFSLKSGFKILGILSDEEIIPFLRTSRSIRTYEKQLLADMVKDTSQVVNCVSRNGRDRSWHSINPDYIINQFSFFRITLGSDFIWFGIKEGFDLGFKIEDVLFGPFNFYLDERNPFIGSHAFNFL